MYEYTSSTYSPVLITSIIVYITSMYAELYVLVFTRYTHDKILLYLIIVLVLYVRISTCIILVLEHCANQFLNSTNKEERYHVCKGKISDELL